MDEIAIIKQIQNGDLDQFSLLYDQYIKKIYNFIYYRTSHKETAEDLTSRTFMKALDKINKFDTTQGYFSAWLYKIARNQVIDYYRTNKNNANLEDIYNMEDKQNLKEDISNKQQLETVKKYLEKLKPDQRDIIIMRVWQDLSYQEIAQIMDKNESACKMQFSRALKKLRKEIPLEALLLLLTLKL